MLKHLPKVAVFVGIMAFLVVVSNVVTVAYAAGDTTAPQISNLQPGGTLTSDSATISAYYSDSGSGIASASVYVYLDGSAVSGCSVGASSVNCSVSGLSNGTHNYTVSVSDNDGNTGSAGSSFTIDAPASACPETYMDASGAAIAVYSDSGYTTPVCQNATLSSNTNYYMQIRHPTMNLNSEGTDRNRMRLRDMMNSQVDYGNGQSEVSFTQQSGGAPYIYRASFRTPSSAGVYGLEPELRNNAQTKEIDITGWKISVGSTTSYFRTYSDSGYTNQTGSFSAGATVYMEMYSTVFTDGTPDAGQTTVTLGNFVGATTTPSETVSKPGSRKYRVQFTLPGTPGDKYAQVRVRTSGGTTLARPDILIDIDSDAPMVTSIQPTGTITSDAATISAYLSDSGTGVNAASAAVYLDGSPLSGCSVVTGTVSCEVTGLADGPHSITVNVSDNAGNQGTGNGSFDVSLAPSDTTDPSVGNLQPTGTLTATSTTISADYSDAGSGVNSATAAVYLDGSPLGGCTATAASVSCPASGLSQGSHTYTVSVDDNAGNTGSASSAFTVDSLGPSVSSIQPTGTITSDAATISAYLSDSGTGVNAASAAVYLDGSPLSGCSVVTGTVSCEVTGLADGPHSITVNVSDNAGNSGTGNGSFTVTQGGSTDNIPPQVTEVLPAGSVDDNNASIWVYYSDSGSAINTAAVSVYVDGVLLTGCSVSGSAIGCDVEDLAPGAHVITGTVADNAGNSTQINGSFNTARQYLWTWYDGLYARNWVLMANPVNATQDATFGLYIGGQERDLSGHNGGVASPGQSLTPAYPGLMGGPVKASSRQGNKSIVSQRTLWGEYSFEEVLGVDSSRLSDHFYWTWYDEQTPGFRDWVMVANYNSFPVYYEVDIAGSQVSSGTIDVDDSATLDFEGVMGGPVEVQAWADQYKSAPAMVMASQRVLSNSGLAFNEAVGVPAEDLSNHYLWTWYDSVGSSGQNWLLVANPNTYEVFYRIDITGGCDNPGENRACETGSIPAGGKVTPAFSGVANGPVEVQAWSDSLDGSVAADVIASQRVIWGPSFGEVMGYPYEDLNSSYHWTWYDQQTAGMLNWVLIANPSLTESVTVEVWINGVRRHEDDDAGKPETWDLAPGGRATPRFGTVMDGPVEIRAYRTGGSWSNPSDRRGVMASQRVLYSGFFNETLGTVLD